MEQNTTLKKEVGITERRLLSRNERIHHLEALLTQADQKLAQKNQKYEAQIQAFRERLTEGTICFLVIAADADIEPQRQPSNRQDTTSDESPNR